MTSLEALVVDKLITGDHTRFVSAPIGVRIRQPDHPLTSLDLD